MRHLLLLRHATAKARSPAGDFERALTPGGRADAARLGAWLLAKELIPDAALVSPSRRTRETADLVLAGLPGAPRPVFNEALYNADAETLYALAEGSKARCLLIIGHNPGIGELAAALAGEEAARLAEGFPPCALAVFEVAGAARKMPRYRLSGAITPDIMPI